MYSGSPAYQKTCDRSSVLLLLLFRMRVRWKKKLFFIYNLQYYCNIISRVRNIENRCHAVIRARPHDGCARIPRGRVTRASYGPSLDIQCLHEFSSKTHWLSRGTCRKKNCSPEKNRNLRPPLQKKCMFLLKFPERGPDVSAPAGTGYLHSSAGNR